MAVPIRCKGLIVAYETLTLRRPLPEMMGEAINLRGESVCPESFEFFVGGFGALALPELHVWRILVLSAGFAAPYRLLVAKGWSQSEITAIRDSVPPSQHGEVILVSDTSNHWIKELGLNQIFAYHRQSSLLMLGPPTEEAWERMENALRA